jgi:hypothetical protein
MYLIQILLPLYDNDGNAFPGELFGQVRNELVNDFGGLTAYTRAPVSGLWQESANETVRDDLVIYEVLSQQLDQQWWANYRRMLEQRFKQERLVVRAHPVQML